MKIATDRLVDDVSLSYAQLGQRWVRKQQQNIAAAERGIRLGAYFGYHFIDDFIKGLRPTELLIAGGEPGMGKSAVWWKAGERFAMSEMTNPSGADGQPLGTLIVSAEMGEEPSSDRLAQSVGLIEGEKLREGTITRDELFSVAKQWAGQRDLPLYVNHSSILRESQLRAIVVENVRQNNIGLVVVDHFRKIRPDDKTLKGNEADDQIVAFLKSGLATDLNVAVICIAHTVKSIERADKRPRMSDLRGSGMIAADADFVGFVYRPWVYASESQKSRNEVTVTDAEMIWEKARHAAGGTGEFQMNLSTMKIYD
jgi:replicative DNA helicase